MKNLNKLTKALEDDAEPKSVAGEIMRAVAKKSQEPNTPGKSGKKSTLPGSKSKPSSQRQKKDFKKSSKKDIPFDAATDPKNEEME